MSEQDDSYLDLLEEELQDKCDTIEFLDAELVRLRAQLAAVPVEALKRQYTIGFHPYQSWLVDQDAILAWLRSLEPQS